jgi:hypothetical protein
MTPSIPEIVDFFLRLEDDPERRSLLDGTPFQIFQAAVDEDLFGRLEQETFARLVGKAVQRDLLQFESTHAAVPPAGAIWSDSDFQMRSGYHVTVEGRQLVELFRRQRNYISPPLYRATPDGADELRDCFICHASEDKEVATPLAQELISRGWSVWLDELDLTVGDSLNGAIETGLARSRFGLVLLSKAFFAKQWTRRELGALAAREVDSKQKVILPVWHGVDHHFILERSPVLADRLGVSTDLGVEKVADEISRALSKATHRTSAGPEKPPSSEAEDEGAQLLSTPTLREDRERLAASQAAWWEYRLFAGAMMEGLLALEGKWQDHELRLASGVRTALGPEPVSEFIRREIGWVRRQASAIERILAAETLERAFGAPGEPGNQERIEATARRIVSIYESLLDWAAKMRSTDPPSEHEEVIELAAQTVDQPLREIRDFVTASADQIARLQILSESATEEKPIVVRMTLRLTVDEQILDRVVALLSDME